MIERWLRDVLWQVEGTEGGTPAASPPATPPATPPPAATTQEHMIPKSRFDEVNTELQRLRKEDERRQKAEREATEKRAQEQGEWQKLADERAARVAELEREVARRDHDALRARVAAKHKLPEALALRLAGDTEADLEKDATELAKLVAPPPAPKTEVGAGSGSAGAGTDTPPATPPAGQPVGQTTPAYRFMEPNDVRW